MRHVSIYIETITFTENVLAFFLYFSLFVYRFTGSSWLPHRISHAIEYGLRQIFLYRTKTTCNIRHLVLSTANVLCSGWNLLRSNGPGNDFNLQANEYIFRLHTITPRRREARADYWLWMKHTVNGHGWNRLLVFLISSMNISTSMEFPCSKYWHRSAVTFDKPKNGLNLKSFNVL